MAAGFVIAMEGFVFPAYAKPVWPSDTGLQAEAGIVVDQETGAVIFGQNIHLQYAPASITKLLTALVVIENCDSLDEMVTFSHDAVYDVESGSGNALSLEEGDQLTVLDCLYALLLRSSNQAANALAEHVGGTREGFVEMMNETIEALGCTESHFANPSGLNDDDQYVSAYDMAIISRAAFANETLLEIDSTTSYSLPGTILNPDGQRVNMEHKLLITTDESSSTYYPYAVAGKTGYTSIAGNTLVTLAQKDGRSQVTVILKSNQTHYSDTIALMEFGFSRFQNVDAAGDEASLFDEDGTLTLDGQTYRQEQVEIEGVQKVTVPYGASLEDTDREVLTGSAMTGAVSEDAVAQVRYVYDERVVGSYYLTVSQVQEEAVSEEDGASQDEEETAEDSQVPEETEAAQGDGSSAVSFAVSTDMILIGVAVVAAAAAVAVVVLHIRRSRERERLEAEMRRERRRQRLAEIGCTEEEFRRLVEERYGREPEGTELMEPEPEEAELQEPEPQEAEAHEPEPEEMEPAEAETEIMEPQETGAGETDPGK